MSFLRNTWYAAAWSDEVFKGGMHQKSVTA
jgi:hypothetical protein